MMDALVATALGVLRVDLTTGDTETSDDELERPTEVDTGLPLVVATDRQGATIAALVDRRPPLVISHDAGVTWHEAGGGLPAGRAIAISPDHPDHMLFATESRLYVSDDGGRFWRVLDLELPAISAVSWLP